MCWTPDSRRRCSPSKPLTCHSKIYVFARQARRGVGAEAGDRRAGHLVLVGAVAILHAGLAGRARARFGGLLPHRRHGDRARHPLLLGRAHGHNGPRVHRAGALSHRLLAWPGETSCVSVISKWSLWKVQPEFFGASSTKPPLCGICINTAIGCKGRAYLGAIS